MKNLILVMALPGPWSSGKSSKCICALFFKIHDVILLDVFKNPCQLQHKKNSLEGTGDGSVGKGPAVQS